MQPSPERIIQMASAFYDSCVLFTASDLGVFNLLAGQPGLTSHQVADQLQLDHRATRLLLDGCVALDLLGKHDDYYENTPETTAFLVVGGAADLSGAIRYNRDVYSAWGRLPELARTGQPVEKPETHLGGDPERTRTFVMSMHYRALGIGRALVPMIEVGQGQRLLDVGGGPGTFSVLLAQANPGLSCTVLDLPEVAAIANELIEQQGVSQQVSTLGGDYRQTPFPPNQDMVNFFGVLHQESPDSIRKLFSKAYDALGPGGRVNVMDMMTDATHTAPKFSAMFALNMALTTNDGWVFSDHELTNWMAEAGFENVDIRPLPPPMPHWMATAVKPDKPD